MFIDYDPAKYIGGMPMEKFLSGMKNFFSGLWSKIREKAGELARKFRESSDIGEKKSLSQKILTGAGIGLCVVFAFLLICNLVIIIKGTVAPEKPPSVFGITPMVVLSGSMSGTAEDHIEVGDLVFINKADPDNLKVGDIIAFMEGTTTVTHRIIRVEYTDEGAPRWITKGDANNKEDSRPVSPENLVGIYSFRIPGLGDVAMFLQQPVGMLLVIGLPCLAFIIYDIIRRQRSAVKQDEKASEMEAELERLRKLVAGQDGVSAESSDPENTEDAEATEESSESDADSEETPAEDAEVSEETAGEASESKDDESAEAEESDEKKDETEGDNSGDSENTEESEENTEASDEA